MKTPHELARGWLNKADSDLNTARAILTTAGPYDTACFHAQQAVEKCLKCFLDLHGRPYPLIHDLGKLAILCEAIDPTLHLSTPAVITLTDYAVVLRYDSEFWPTREVAVEALNVAEQVRSTIAGLLPPGIHP